MTALDKLLDAAADLTVAEMREIKKSIENRIPARVSAAYDTVCALNEWGQTRRSQPRLQEQVVPPLDAKIEPGAITYIPGPAPVAPYKPPLSVVERADKYSPPTIDDVKHLVGLALPPIVRIQQLRRLLGMGKEPFGDDPETVGIESAEKARRAIRAWVHRAAPFTTIQLQDMLDTIAERLGEQNKD